MTGVQTCALPISNTNSNGWFWLGMLFLIFIVLLVTLSNFGIEVAILSSSLIALILGVFLVYMNLIAWSWVLFFLALILITFTYIIYVKRN